MRRRGSAMRRLGRWMAPGGLLLLGLLSCSGEQARESELHDTGREIIGPPEAAAALVDGDTVRLAEANLLANYWIDATPAHQRRELSRRDLQRRAVESLVQQLVLMHEAERRGFTADDSVLDARLAQWEQQSGTAEEVAERLERSHVTKETVREHLRRDAVIQQMVAELIQDTLQISDAEIAAYYREHPEYFDNLQIRARHILLKTNPDDTPEQRAQKRERAAALRDSIQAGGDFAALARAHSECPSAPQGGELPPARRGQWVPPFEQAALALQPGEISDVVETDYGYHIIELLERNDQEAAPLEQVAPTIRQFLRNQKTQAAVDRLAADLKAAAEIVEFVPPPAEAPPEAEAEPDL
ncbi:MAG: hypothetical protein GF330_04745 [Candidatus Eisenbacteria bacterium]|nr:hypothetical protein [Candidatus Eisenbacteria bacterium]